MRLVVDASIWIDLDIGGVLAEVFGLPLESVSPDVILQELDTVDPRLIKALGADEAALNPQDYSLLRHLIQTYPSPSVQDLTALAVAIRDGIALLSGDRRLRRAAEEEGVEVHGVLWVLKRMVHGQVVTPGRATDALDAMIDRGSRLPHQECRRLLARWRGR